MEKKIYTKKNEVSKLNGDCKNAYFRFKLNTQLARNFIRIIFSIQN